MPEITQGKSCLPKFFVTGVLQCLTQLYNHLHTTCFKTELQDGMGTIYFPTSCFPVKPAGDGLAAKWGMILGAILIGAFWIEACKFIVFRQPTSS